MFRDAYRETLQAVAWGFLWVAGFTTLYEVGHRLVYGSWAQWQ